ncbi:branched-chain amino acid ABC transporter permease, partial [Pseudonocardia sp. ICBG1293]|uniref:branched-chain amino acid ABC transporter permease n=1 Tax=Pseudonocardia sp. ICBG1293 TaxID=2844382 RepID=UPI002104E25C
LAVEVFNRKSIYGKAVVATANDRDAAGLMGINTGMVITFSYALSSATAAFAGVLVAPLTLTGATMGASLGLKAFAVAIIGGLTSGVGAIVGGLILGIAETTTGYYISTGYKEYRACCSCCWCWPSSRPACSAKPRSRKSEDAMNRKNHHARIERARAGRARAVPRRHPESVLHPPGRDHPDLRHPAVRPRHRRRLHGAGVAGPRGPVRHRFVRHGRAGISSWARRSGWPSPPASWARPCSAPSSPCRPCA